MEASKDEGEWRPPRTRVTLKGKARVKEDLEDEGDLEGEGEGEGRP